MLPLRRHLPAALIFVGLALSVYNIWHLYRPTKPTQEVVAGDSFDQAIVNGEPDWYISRFGGGFTHRPNATRKFAWPEHPSGYIIQKTNDLGFREDDPTKIQLPPGFQRMLVIGDSHIDGVVFNSESFPNQLEKLLTHWDVLNAAVGSYGPLNYRQQAVHWIDRLKPNAIVIVIYLGNDFIDELRYILNTDHLKRPSNYFANLDEANAVDSGAVSQGMNQAYLFETLPRIAPVAVEAVTQELIATHLYAQKSGIKSLFLLLPSALTVEKFSKGRSISKAAKILNLNQNKIVRLETMLKQKLFDNLREAKLEVLDLESIFKEHAAPKYWQKDCHLNDFGHNLIAKSTYAKWGALMGDKQIQARTNAPTSTTSP